MDQDDKKLIADAQADKEKFGLLYLKYAQKVYRFILFRARHDRNIALDLMQETFTRAFSHIGDFSDRGYSYLSYLLKIAKNLLINRGRRPTEISLDQLMENRDWKEPAEEGPNEPNSTDQEHKECLSNSIDKLKPAEKNLYKLFYQQNWPIKKIALKIHKTENAVKLALARLRRKIKLEMIKTTPLHKSRVNRK